MHTIATKTLGDDGDNILDVIVHKEPFLPMSDVARYRATHLTLAGGPDVMPIYLFQIDDERVLDPELNLRIGEFQIRADDLPENAVLRKGDEVIVHWAQSESQDITTEVQLPTVRQRFDRRNYYNCQLAPCELRKGRGVQVGDDAPQARRMQSFGRGRCGSSLMPSA
jgi:hypothetical protein